MDAFFVTLAAVAIGEIGDKTQLLALLLAARFKRPVYVLLGIAAAVLTNHTLAGLVGRCIGHSLSPTMLRWGLGLSFLAMAVWALKPDEVTDELGSLERFGVFLATFVTFFLAEMGDKTQVITAMLAAKYSSLPAVIAGSTLGMLVADVPAVFVGHTAAQRMSLRMVRYAAVVLFGMLGVATLLGVGEVL